VFENAGTDLGFLTVGSFEQAVINDISIDSIVTGERFKGISYSYGEKCRKAQPACLRTVKKTVETILLE
jgi:hypothetical protein